MRLLAETLSLPSPLCALLTSRGLRDPDAVRRFLQAPLSDLHPPGALRDIDRAVERIGQAIDMGEVMLVHGDYDVDGITSTALLTRTLRALGARVVPFVPHRITDGYDLSAAGVRAAREHGATLVITCDCGTTAVSPVTELNAAGVDVIITDHHLPSAPLPDAIALLNPRRRGCEYPDKDLVAGAVTFKLALAVTRVRGGNEGFVFDMLDLVALATVADVAPLRGENRILVRHGLRRMADSNIPGVRALLRACGLDAKELTAGRVGFILAPRINAAGRVGSAMRALELLLTDDESEALGIARELEELNQYRQDLDRATLQSARRQLDAIDLDETFGIVLASDEWHPGVIGIVASRVVEETARPTVLVAVEGGVGKGSGRSIPAFDLHGALSDCQSLFVRFGGHRAAAGITIDASRIDEFAMRFNAVARGKLTRDDLSHELRVDLAMPLSMATEDLLDALRHCEPYGVGNPSPVFLATNVRAQTPPRRIGETGMRVRIEDETGAVDAVAWDFAHRLADFDWRAPFDVAYRLERDEWQGRTRLQARLCDVRQ
jgi:single-stranded-DNA-specific exonuclease